MTPDHSSGNPAPRDAERGHHRINWSDVAGDAADALRFRLAVVGPDGTIVAVNAAWRESTVLPGPEAGEGRNIFTLCADTEASVCPEAERVADGLRQVLAGQLDSCELDVHCPALPGQGWLGVRLSPLTIDGRRMAVIACDDISARKQIELTLRETQEAHDRAQALTRAGSWRADFGTQTFTPSREGARLLGWTPGPHTFAELFALIHPEDRGRQEEAWMAAIRSRSRFDMEHRMQLAGEERWVRVIAEFMFGPDGRAIAAYGVTQDITEIRDAETARAELEDRLRQAHKLEAIGLLAGGVAHDFNNLLTVISGNTELLKSHVGGLEATRLLSEIGEASSRAAALTRRLLAFSRAQVLAPAVVPVNTLIAKLEAILGRLIGEDIRCTFELADDAGYVRVDATQFEQVMLNLAVNARDAMPNGGQLSVRTRPVRLDGPDSAVDPHLAPGAYVDIEVADTGHGMTPDVMARVFEPFFTTKEPGRGTGLGLSMAFGIVKQSGGHLDVRSRVGEGATFIVRLPCVEPVGGPRAASQPETTLTRGHETILLVEDETSVRKLARLALERSGYTVLVAENGLAALELAAAHGGPIDMLVTDVVMPEMRGPVLARTLAARRPGMRVLFVSGYVQDALDREGVSDAEFLLKPFTLKELSDRVREILDGAKH